MGSLTFRQLKIKEILNLNEKNVSPKGWIEGGKCPFCQRDDKFGVKFNEIGKYKNHISFNCYHGSCQEKGSEFKLLKQLNMLHIITDGEFIGAKRVVENKLNVVLENNLDLNVMDRLPPLGFRRVYSNKYLESRGFESWQFKSYHIGVTTFNPKMKDYVVFLVEEDGKVKGSVVRLAWTREKSTAFKEKYGFEKPRYLNEGGVDFGKLLFGVDEIIVDKTEEVVLVEGVTDKANIDKLLRLDKNDKVKCVCTFGKKISEEQIMKLFLRGVKKITVLYDPDAIQASKRYGNDLKLYFDVKIGYLDNVDPGDLTLDMLNHILSNLRSVNQFSVDIVQKRSLT